MSGFARLTFLALGSWLAVSFSTMVQAATGPAESLFRLVPPDASATLAVEDLRGNARAFLTSPVAEGFRRLPAFQDWMASEHFRRFDQALRQVEGVFGERLSTLRDEVLGDAVVLTLRVPPGGRPEDARGLLLVRSRNRPLLDRLIRDVNAAQRRSGELTRLESTLRGGVPYWTREYRAASRKPNDYYTVLDDHTLAWSNAEDLVQGVIDRGAGHARSLADDPRFQRARGRLPTPAVVSLFVDPPYLVHVLKTSTPVRPQRPVNDRAAKLLGRYLGAMEYLGIALQWHDGIVLSTEEILNPEKLDPWVRRWAGRPGEASPDHSRLPDNALAVASIHLDLPAILDVVRLLIPEAQQPRLDNLILALNGVLLGHELQTEILPQLGPNVLAYMEAPPEQEDEAQGPRLSKVVFVGLSSASGLTAALENGLRTFLAFYALDQRHGNGLLQLGSRDVAGRKIVSLRPTSPFAFAIDRDRLVLGSTPAAVAHALTVPPASGGGTTPTGDFARLRADRFPDAGSFACFDLTRLSQYVLSHRSALAARLAAGKQRPVEEAARDLDQAVALMKLFRHAYLTSAIEPNAIAVHRTLGLVARPAAAPGPAP